MFPTSSVRQIAFIDLVDPFQSHVMILIDHERDEQRWNTIFYGFRLRIANAKAINFENRKAERILGQSFYDSI